MNDFDSVRQLARAAERRAEPFEARRRGAPGRRSGAQFQVASPNGVAGTATLSSDGSTAEVRLKGRYRATVPVRWVEPLPVAA